MPPKTDRRRSSKDAPRKMKKKVCIFCAEHIAWVDYKDVNLLRRFMSERGKIRARRVTGNCQQHQRDVAIAIKTAREIALLPYTQRTMTERGPRGGGRGGGGGRGRDDAAPDRGEAAVAAAVDVDTDLDVELDLDVDVDGAAGAGAGAGGGDEEAGA
jgi:small subunit ribosomal protein S18